jgi:hypothetical protein
MQNTNESDLKQCIRCKEYKTKIEYGNRLGKKLSVCKKCINNAQKKQYANNKPYYLDRNREHRANNRNWYQALKNKTPCAKCGTKYPYYVMDYDHLDPSTKVLCIAHMMGHSRKAILNEISKCELLCANCHRIKTYETSDRQKQHRITTSYKRIKP